MVWTNLVVKQSLLTQRNSYTTIFIAAINIAAVMFCALFLNVNYTYAASYKPINLTPDYEHDKFVTRPKDIVLSFCAYITSFDSDDDNNGDGIADYWRVPEFVTYEIRAFDGTLGKGPKRPSI